MNGDVEAALERLRMVLSVARNGYSLGLEHPADIIERHIEAQAAEIERLRAALRGLVTGLAPASDRLNAELLAAHLDALTLLAEIERLESELSLAKDEIRYGE